MEYSRPDTNLFEVSQSFFVTPGFPYYTTRARSGPRSHFVSREDILSLMKKYYIYEELIDLVECNI